MKSLDLISVGRCAVDLYCDQLGVPLAEGRSLSMYVGGCPANVAVGASRLGLRVAMLTRVGVDATGDFVLTSLAREGVDVSHVVRDEAGRTPLVLADIHPPSGFNVTYYNDRAAYFRLAAADAEAEWLGSSRAMLVSGHSLLDEAAAAALQSLVATARAQGTRIVFDIDYRASLWSTAADETAARLGAFLSNVDLLVGTAEEYQALAGGLPLASAVAFAEAIVPGVCVLKLGADGAQAAGHHVAGYAVDPLNLLGAGDAFLAGFLSGWLRDESIPDCLRRGNANGAIVVTRHGCSSAMPYRTEVEAFLASSDEGLPGLR